MPAFHARAYAKINLHLHITGRADNGYHLLDSLVAFTGIHDDIEISPSLHDVQLSISGETSSTLATLSPQDNLITRAAYLLAEHLDIPALATIHLTKKIPLAAGLGGGSADAAATLLLLKDVWGINVTHDILSSIAARMGSDVVACLHQTPLVMRGTGNTIYPSPSLPKLYALLVNPNIECPTPTVYKTYREISQRFSENIIFPDSFKTASEFCTFLNSNTENDLTAAAIKVAPEIMSVLTVLENLDSSLLSRLSGSGATCFALFDNPDEAQENKRKINKDHPDWWVVNTMIRRS